jgi:hypothetical protein
MNLIETLVAKATEEACELGKAFSKLNFAGIKATDSETGEPLTLGAIKELNQILACVELLRDRGIPLAGIGDPVAVGEAKRVIVEDMEKAMQAGTLTLSEDDQNPRPEGVNEADTGMPEGEEGEGQGGDNDQGDLGADGTGASDGDGTAPEGSGDGSDDTSGDDAGDQGDDTDSDDSGDNTEEEESEDDSSDDDAGTGDDAGESEDESSEEEEEEEPGSNDV